MSVNIKKDGELVKVANNISIVQADWNDRNNTNKNTCIKNQPDTIKTTADLEACEDENALAGALMVKEGISEVKSEIPTKTSQLTNDKGFKSSSEVVSNYDDIMANTVSGYVPDALAVKEGFQEINDSLSRTFESLTNTSIDITFNDVGTNAGLLASDFKIEAANVSHVSDFVHVFCVGLTCSKAIPANTIVTLSFNDAIFEKSYGTWGGAPQYDVHAELLNNNYQVRCIYLKDIGGNFAFWPVIFYVSNKPVRKVRK